MKSDQIYRHISRSTRSRFSCLKRIYYEQEKNYKCERCGTLFSSKQGLEYHIESFHDKERRVECDLCDKVYTYKSTLTRHKRLVHNVGLKTETTVSSSK